MTITSNGELVGPPDPAEAAPAPPEAVLAEAPAVVAMPEAIDIGNDSQVQDTLARAVTSGVRVLVADASRTTFCGCSGVTVLVLAHRRAGPHPGPPPLSLPAG